MLRYGCQKWPQVGDRNISVKNERKKEKREGRVLAVLVEEKLKDA